MFGCLYIRQCQRICLDNLDLYSIVTDHDVMHPEFEFPLMREEQFQTWLIFSS